MEEGKKKIVVQVAIFVVTFAVAFFGTKYVMSGATSTQSVLEKTSKKMNKKCPMMLTSDIRLDYTDAMAVEGKGGMLYVCTLINEDVKDKNFNADLVAKETKLAAQKDFDSNPDLEKIRKRSVTVYYECKDKNGISLLGFEIYGVKNNAKK